MISRKKSNLSSCFDIEYNSAKSLKNEYKLFGTKSKLPERIDRIKIRFYNLSLCYLLQI